MKSQNIQILVRSLLSFLFAFLCLSSVSSAASLQNETLGSTNDGYGVSVAVGSGNKIAISFQNSSSFALKYMERAGQSWKVEQIESLGALTDTATVIKDFVAHVFYIKAGTQLVHAWKSSADWQKEIVTSETLAGSLSATTCGQDLCLSFYNSQSKVLRFARLTNGSWSLATVDSSAEVGAMNSIAANSAGEVAVAYFDAINKQLKVATQQSGSWVAERVSYVDHKFGVSPSIKFDEGGALHVSSSRYTSGVAVDLSAYYSVKRPGGSWMTAELSRDYAGGPTALTLHDGNIPRVAFRHLQNSASTGFSSEVRLASNAGSLWSEESLTGDLGTASVLYAINKVAAANDQWGNTVTVYSFSRDAYASSAARSGIRLYRGPDSDGDEVPDNAEVQYGTNPNVADSDGDGVSDGVELFYFGSNPLDRDSDGDGVSDGSDNCPININSEQLDADGDGVGDACEEASYGDWQSSSSSSPAVTYPDEDNWQSEPVVLDSDNDGLTNTEEAQLGTDPYNADTDGDGVNDKDEISQGTNPLDHGSVVIVLPTSFCQAWSDYGTNLAQILELANVSGQTAKIEVGLYQTSGKSVGKLTLNLASGAQRDIPINSTSGARNLTAGRICVSHNLGEGDIDARVVAYDAQDGSNENLGFTAPASSGKLGTQAVTFGSHPVSSDEKLEEWVEVSNPTTSLVKGTLRVFNSAGKQIVIRKVSIGARGVYRAQLTSSVSLSASMARWKPDRQDLRVVLRGIRFIRRNSDGLALAATQIEGEGGSGEIRTLPVDTKSKEAAVEISNVLSGSAKADVRFYTNKGKLVKRIVTTLTAYSSRRYSVASILGANKVGTVSVRSTTRSSLVSTAVQYRIGDTGSTRNLYALSGREAVSMVAGGSYNTNLNQSNQLMVVNSGSVAIPFAVRMTRASGQKVTSMGASGWITKQNGSTLVVPAHGVVTVDLSALESSNQYGIVLVQTSLPKTMNAWVLRSKNSQYTIPVPVR